MRKRVFRGINSEAQISLRIRAVCLGPLLSAKRIIGYYRMYEWARAEWYFGLAQDELNLCILCVFEGTFSLDEANFQTYFRFIPMETADPVWYLNNQPIAQERRLPEEFFMEYEMRMGGCEGYSTSLYSKSLLGIMGVTVGLGYGRFWFTETILYYILQ